MADREVSSWITINGQHVPIFKGETKEDAAKRAIKRSQENIKKDGSEKDKQIKKNKAEKDKLNGKEELTNHNIKKEQISSLKSGDVIQVKTEDGDFEYRKKDDGKWHTYDNGEDLELTPLSDEEVHFSFTNLNSDKNEKLSIIKKESSNEVSKTGSGKAVDEVRGNKEPKQTWSKWDGQKYDAEFMKESLSEMKRYERNWSGMSSRDKRNIAPGGIKELRSEISRLQSYMDVPASFASNYPSLSNAELKKKYEEYLKKNRKK